MPDVVAEIPFLCRYKSTVELEAGVEAVIDIPIDGARWWLAVIENDAESAGSIDAATVAASPLGQRFEAPATISTGLPVAAGASMQGLRGAGEPVRTLRVALTSNDGATVHIEAGGW